MIRVGILDKSEYSRLLGLLPDNSWIPDPSISRVVVAEDDGRIVGFWVGQMQFHVEPVWVHEEYRNGIALGCMWKCVKQMLPKRYWAFSDSNQISAYLKRLGLKRSQYEVYIGG